MNEQQQKTDDKPNDLEKYLEANQAKFMIVGSKRICDIVGIEAKDVDYAVNIDTIPDQLKDLIPKAGELYSVGIWCVIKFKSADYILCVTPVYKHLLNVAGTLDGYLTCPQHLELAKEKQFRAGFYAGLMAFQHQGKLPQPETELF